jgi:acetyl esterase/lipase
VTGAGYIGQQEMRDFRSPIVRHARGLIGCLVLTCCFAGPHRARAGESLRDPDDIAIFHDIPYREGLSRAWRLDLAVKKEKAARPRPGILIIHGGGWLEGDKSSFASRVHGVPGNIVDFAALGFVAATINYRLSPEAPFPAALEDCKCAVRWLRAHASDYNLDGDHIGAYGNSAGGHLAMLLGMTGKDAGLEGDGPHRDRSSRVHAVVSDSGPIDLLYQIEKGSLKQVVKQFMGGPPEGDRVAAYKAASPSCRISSDAPPMLLIYGVSDDQVPIETADRFVLDLGRAGVQDLTYYRLAYVYHCPHSLVRLPWLRPAVEGFFVRTLMHPETATEVVRRIGPG